MSITGLSKSYTFSRSIRSVIELLPHPVYDISKTNR
jgi:hypothetical protein